MRPSQGRARPRLAPIFCLVLASFAETSCGRGLWRRTNVAEMRGPPLVSLLPGDRMVLRGGGDGEGDEDMFDNGGGPMEPGEEDNAGVRRKLNDIMEATTEEERGKFTANAAAEIKRLGQKGAIQVDMGEGLKVPMFLGKPPANYTSEHQDAWHKFQREMEGKGSEGNALGLKLADAAGNGSTAECESLLEDGADPNFVDPREWLGTPLHRAAKQGHAQTCSRLLDMGAYASSTDYHGTTAMMYAAENGHTEVARMLLQAGSDLGHHNKVGNTALHKAAAKGQKQTVAFLLDCGLSPDVRNRDGSTPLHLAAFFGHTGMCRLLVESGAKFDAQDDEGQTPAREAKIMMRKSALVYLASLNPGDRSWDRPLSGNAYHELEQHLKIVRPKPRAGSGRISRGARKKGEILEPQNSDQESPTSIPNPVSPSKHPLDNSQEEEAMEQKENGGEGGGGDDEDEVDREDGDEQDENDDAGGGTPPRRRARRKSVKAPVDKSGDEQIEEALERKQAAAVPRRQVQLQQ